MKRFLLFALLLVLSTGCATRKVSTTSRTAIEQLLLSTVVDKALEKFDMPMLKDSKVFVDCTLLKGTDVEYVQVALRARTARQGAILVTEANDADYIMEVASGGLAMEFKDRIWGLPSLPVPQAPIPLPEIAMFKTIHQTAIMKLLIFVHQKGRFVASDQYFARSDRDESIVMWHRFQRTDDIRTGWERADASLTAKTAEDVAENKNGSKDKAP